MSGKADLPQPTEIQTHGTALWQTLRALSVEGTIIKHKTYATRAAVFTQRIVLPPEPNRSANRS